MDKKSEPTDYEALHREAVDIWEQNAAFWDEKFGEGNAFQRLLIGPATDRLLALTAGEQVLDLACGNGHYARHMADRGAQVVACDISPTFIELAKKRSTGYGDRITYRVMDATDENQLLSLGEGRFQAAVCTMALMDIARIEPIFTALARLLKPGGRFVFSVTHPCFNHPGAVPMAEQFDGAEGVTTVFSVKVSAYLHQEPAKGTGIIGQPAAQFYFSRTLSALFGAGFGAGFVLDGLEEPAFDETAQAGRLLAWANFQKIPPVLVARMRLPAG